MSFILETLRVQVPNNHILAQNLHYDYYELPKPKYLSIGYMDPLGEVSLLRTAAGKISGT